MGVEGVQLIDEHGQAIQLMGMSSHGLHWFPNCYSKEAIQHLVEHWGINLFRAALYVGEGGYSQQPGLKSTVKNIVQWCKELGIYVMIDWHVLTPGDPNAATYAGAVPFFEEMAAEYKDEKHVLFEICNEPNGVQWSTVKTYADGVISAIRAIDNSTVVIVGTPTWSQTTSCTRSIFMLAPICNSCSVFAKKPSRSQYLRQSGAHPTRVGMGVRSWTTRKPSLISSMTPRVR